MRRITVDLADDVRAMIDQVRRERGWTFKQAVNEAMRLGFILDERDRQAASTPGPPVRAVRAKALVQLGAKPARQTGKPARAPLRSAPASAAKAGRSRSQKSTRRRGA
jgi:hypothetical protein